MPRWIDWSAIVFVEATGLAVRALIGAVLGGLTGFGVWWAITPADAPHGGGLAIPGMIALGGLVGAVIGLVGGIVSAVRRNSKN